MNRELSNQVLKLNGREFAIQGVIGRGASCVVYRAICPDKTEHLLKEYNPRNIATYRDKDGFLCLENEADRAEFEAGLVRFREGHAKQRELRLDSDLKNVTSNVQDIYCANGTEYIDMTCFAGDSYENVQEKSVYNLLRRMKAVAQVVGNYHRAGLLHLDIKPANIFTLPETCEMVMLFDFDSVVSKASITAGGARSYTLSWAAPEQINPTKRRHICEATDIFAVGEMFFFQLMGRHSEVEERRSFASYSFDHKAHIFENVSPKVFPLLEDLLHHTICVSAKQRYQTTAELVEQLDKIIKIADPKEPYLKSSLPAVQEFFVGREGEIQEIHRMLNENRILFLNGFGGIGKSELAKHYAEEHKDDYDAIIFAPYVSDVKMLLLDDNAIPLYNFTPYPEEKPEEYCARKLKKLRELCDERTLFIVDNLDCEDDPDLNKLLDLGCKLLITTRRDFSGFGKPQLYVDKLANAKKIREIFDKYYKVQNEVESACVDEIIVILEGHTMAVELVAKQIEAEWATAEEIIVKLKESGVAGIGDSSVDSGKDGFASRNTYAHVKALFNLAVFRKSTNALYVLGNLAFVPHTGIDRKLFSTWCELDKHGGKPVVNDLIKTGWIRQDKNSKTISLHPLLAEVIHAASVEDDFSSLLKNLTKHINAEDEGAVIPVSERMFLELMSIQIMRAVKMYHYSSNDISSVLMGIGNFFYRNIKYDIAEEAFSLSLKIRQENDDFNSYGCVLSRASVGLMIATIGGQVHDTDKIQEGIAILDSCLEVLYSGIDGHDDLYEEICGVYNYLAMAYEDLPDVDKSLDMYKCGLNILENRVEKRKNDYLGIAIFYNNIGHLYENAVADYTRACENYEKALTYYRKIASKNSHVIKTLYHLGSIYANESYPGFDLSKARSLAREAFPIAKELFDCKHPLYVHTIYLYGKVELLLGNKEEGKLFLQQAYDVYMNNLRDDNPRLIWLKKVLAQ